MPQVPKVTKKIDVSDYDKYGSGKVIEKESYTHPGPKGDTTIFMDGPRKVKGPDPIPNFCCFLILKHTCSEP